MYDLREHPGEIFRRVRAKWIHVILAAGCLAWLLVRSGRKPSRLRYPCQQAALAQSAWLVPALGVWLSRSIKNPRVRRAVTAPLLLALLAAMALGLGGDVGAGASGFPDLRAASARAEGLVPAMWRGSGSGGSHDVFVVSHVPAPRPESRNHPGVDALLRMLAEGGVYLYRSGSDAYCAAPDGIIAKDDVVLLKVNAAWDQRGMTNTDVVKGIITAVLSHPDGFTGEVVLVENCEGGPDYDQVYNNAENVFQSFRAVVDSFGDPARVSCSSWWSFTDRMVAEYDAGDVREGYVWVGDNVSYPKFTTGRGTRVSLKRGVWDGSRYDKSRMKLINIPVLKSHNATGVTGCLKNFMGVPSIHRTTDVHSDLIYRGFMGRLMNEVIYPDLNILDAIWISPSHPRGPEGPYSLAVRTDILLAGKDPVAVDYYAAKHVLYAVSNYGRHDPDTPHSDGGKPYHDGSPNTGYPYNAFRLMLDSTTRVLRLGGRDVTCDPGTFSVHLRDISAGTGISGGHCATGVAEPSREWYFAEGTTRPGFDEWICLGNPQPSPVRATLTFMTGEGEVIPFEVAIMSRSRATVHVRAVVGLGKDVSCTVVAQRPIVAERPMYFAYECERLGGHTVVGTKSPAVKWYFAEGYTGAGFDEWICVLNPGSGPAGLTFRFQDQDAGEIVRKGGPVGARTRATFKVNDLVGDGRQCSLALESDRPVIAERSIYFDYLGTGEFHWDGGHCVMGATVLSNEYYFAEGTTREGFEEWLCLQNPGPGEITVEATYVLGPGQGQPVKRKYAVGPRRRVTVFVASEVGTGKDVSVRLRSSARFLAERPVYFSYGGQGAQCKGGHCVVGSPAPYRECFFAEGYTGPGFEEWICLQNPGEQKASVELAYMTQEAGELPVRLVSVPARTRVTVFVNESAGRGYQLSCRVKVRSGPPIVAERPIYFNR